LRTVLYLDHEKKKIDEALDWRKLNRYYNLNTIYYPELDPRLRGENRKGQ